MTGQGSHETMQSRPESGDHAARAIACPAREAGGRADPPVHRQPRSVQSLQVHQRRPNTLTAVAPSAKASSSARSVLGTSPPVAANNASSSDSPAISPTHATAACRSTRPPEVSPTGAAYRDQLLELSPGCGAIGAELIGQSCERLGFDRYAGLGPRRADRLPQRAAPFQDSNRSPWHLKFDASEIFDGSERHLRSGPCCR